LRDAATIVEISQVNHLAHKTGETVPETPLPYWSGSRSVDQMTCTGRERGSVIDDRLSSV
jgi:hypothetical protein